MMRPIIIRDLRHKEKFQVDDAYLNGWAKQLGMACTCIYLSLCRHADKEQKSFPSIILLAQEHNISTKTVQRAIKRLQDFNIIHFEKTRTATGKWLNNTYFLQDKSIWGTRGHQSPVEPQDILPVEPQDIFDKTTGHLDPTKDTHIEGYTYKDSNSLKRISLLRKKAHQITGKPMVSLPNTEGEVF